MACPSIMLASGFEKSRRDELDLPDLIKGIDVGAGGAAVACVQFAEQPPRGCGLRC